MGRIALSWMQYDSSVSSVAACGKAQQLPARPVTLNGMTGSSVVPRVLVDELGLGPVGVSDLELPVLQEADLGRVTLCRLSMHSPSSG